MCDLVMADWAKSKPASAPAPAVEAPDSAAPATPGTTNVAYTPAPVNVTIAVSSVPDGADIQIDGEFVGNAPSAVELQPGVHVVTVVKKGYQSWERKVKVSGGSISLRAELDPIAK